MSWKSFTHHVKHDFDKATHYIDKPFDEVYKYFNRYTVFLASKVGLGSLVNEAEILAKSYFEDVMTGKDEIDFGLSFAAAPSDVKKKSFWNKEKDELEKQAGIYVPPAPSGPGAYTYNDPTLAALMLQMQNMGKEEKKEVKELLTKISGDIKDLMKSFNDSKKGGFKGLEGLLMNFLDKMESSISGLQILRLNDNNNKSAQQTTIGQGFSDSAKSAQLEIKAAVKIIEKALSEIKKSEKNLKALSKIMLIATIAIAIGTGQPELAVLAIGLYEMQQSGEMDKVKTALTKKLAAAGIPDANIFADIIILAAIMALSGGTGGLKAVAMRSADAATETATMEAEEMAQTFATEMENEASSMAESSESDFANTSGWKQEIEMTDFSTSGKSAEETASESTATSIRSRARTFLIGALRFSGLGLSMGLPVVDPAKDIVNDSMKKNDGKKEAVMITAEVAQAFLALAIGYFSVKGMNNGSASEEEEVSAERKSLREKLAGFVSKGLRGTLEGQDKIVMVGMATEAGASTEQGTSQVSIGNAQMQQGKGEENLTEGEALFEFFNTLSKMNTRSMEKTQEATASENKIYDNIMSGFDSFSAPGNAVAAILA